MDFELEKQDEGWMREFRDASRAQAERPGAFWSAQRERIRARIGEKRRSASLRLALGSTLALVVVAAAMLIGDRSPVVLKTPQQAAAQMVSDQQLLADIDETLANPTPDALAPMELISQDLDNSFRAQNGKETR